MLDFDPMSRIHTLFAPHLLLALLFVTLVGLAGCGGGAGKKDEDEPPAPPTLYALSGTVTGNDGAPIADALVIVRAGDGSNDLLDSAISGGDGTYTVSIPGATAFYLHVAKAAYTSSNSHIREITGRTMDVDLVLLLQVQSDTLLQILGGPANFTTAHLLYLVQARDGMGVELADVTVSVTPIGLLVLYRQADDMGYTLTGPSVACTVGGGCSLPQMAGYSQAVNQGVSTFRLSQSGTTLAFVAAPLIPGELTFISNN